MQFKQKIAHIALSCVLLLGVVLFINAQALRKAQIAFTSGRDGNSEVYVMDADGSNQRNLNADGYDPDWFDPAVGPVSPAGKLGTTWGWLKQNGE